MTEWMAREGQNRLYWNSKLPFSPVASTQYRTHPDNVLSTYLSVVNLTLYRQNVWLQESDLPDFPAVKQHWSLNSESVWVQSPCFCHHSLVDGAGDQGKPQRRGGTCAVLSKRKKITGMWPSGEGDVSGVQGWECGGNEHALMTCRETVFRLQVPGS